MPAELALPGNMRTKFLCKNKRAYCTQALGNTLLFLFFWAVPVQAAYELPPAPPHSPTGNTTPLQCLLGTPTGDQASFLFSLLLPTLATEYKGPVSTLHVPGKGGSFALRDLTTPPLNPSRIAALHMPGFLLQAVRPNPLFSPEQIQPLALFGAVPLALWVPESSRFTTLESLITYARTAEKPLVIAGVGQGTEQKMATAILSREAGIPLLYLPTTGTTESRKATGENQVLACWGYAMAPATMPGMRALAVATAQPCPALPGVPTFASARIRLELTQYLGLCAATGTNQDALNQLAQQIKAAATNPGFLTPAIAAGMQPLFIQGEGIAVFFAEQQAALAAFMREYEGVDLWN